MTDDFNTKDGKDKVSLKVDTNDKKSGYSESPAELYGKGIEHFRKKYIHLELDRNGSIAFHNIYRLSKPIPIKGITYPQHFEILQEVYDDDGGKEVLSVFNFMPEYLRDFWSPIVKYNNDETTPLYKYSDYLLTVRERGARYIENKGLEYMHTPFPNELGKDDHPKSFIPAKEWFDPRIVNEVTFSDIFILFPEAEQEIIKLWLGRVGCGRTNSIWVGRSEPIVHTARMALVVLGKEAGTGKSTIANAIYEAIRKTGLTVESFRNTSTQFGGADIALCDVCFKDDVSPDSLIKFLKAEESKILISNGDMSVEEKFKKRITVQTRSSLLINSNTWTSQFAYDLDSGIQSRIKTVTTRSKIELEKDVFRQEGALKGCLDLRPFKALDFLSKKYNCDKSALMLWAVRIATDRFYELITTEHDTLNPLEEEVNKYTSQLRYRFKDDILNSLVSSMALTKVVFNKIKYGDDFEPTLPEFSFKLYYELLRYFYFISTDPSGYEYCTFLKESWIDTGRKTIHPYQSLRDLQLRTVKQSLDWIIENYSGFLRTGITNRSEADLLKQASSYILFRDGFKLGGGITYFIDSFNHTAYNMGELSNLGNAIIEALPIEDKDRMLAFIDGKVETSDSWMDDINYTPRRAEELRKIAKEKMYEKTKNSHRENR